MSTSHWRIDVHERLVRLRDGPRLKAGVTREYGLYDACIVSTIWLRPSRLSR
jgi:hypothetical protein